MSWLKATSSRRKTYYTKNNVNTAFAPVKWSNTLAAAAQNWTDYLIEQTDDCKKLTDPAEIADCYSFDNGFVTHCKPIHEGMGIGNPDPYGKYRVSFVLEVVLCDALLTFFETSTGLENLAGVITSADRAVSQSTAESIMQAWWDSEEATQGGHFFSAAKMSSRYMGCAWSQMTIPTRPGAICRLTACRFMGECGSLFEPKPTWCALCPKEGC